jgi:hypothetical protein
VVNIPESLNFLKTARPGALVVGLVVLGISRVFRLHDWVSNALGIRHSFDVRHILIPLAGETNRKLSFKRLDQISNNRRKLMAQVFYKYASSSEGKTVIDKHLVCEALDWWGWYWCTIEASVVLVLGSFVAAGFKRYGLSTIFLTSTLIILLVSRWIKNSRCVAAARDEISAIVDDRARSKEIGEVFGALQD